MNQVVQVGDVLRMDRQPVDIQPEQEYRAFGMRSFGRGTIRYPPTIGSRLTKLPHFTFNSNALVLSNIKAWEGAVGVTDEEDAKCVASSRFLFYTPRGEEADVRYMRYFFLTRQGLGEIGKASRGSADRNRTLSIRAFEQIKIPLPRPVEQRRIADKLDAAMGSIARVVQLKKESDAVVRQHADALFGSIAKQRPLSSVLDESHDFVGVSPENTYRTAGILNRGRGLFLRPVILGKETKYPRYNQLKSQQFVYSKLFGWEGSLAVVPEDFAGVHVSHEFPTFDIDKDVADISYMTHLARWDGLHHRLKDQGSGMGSRRQRINVSRLLATEVPLPSLAEQRRVAERLTLAQRVAEASARQVADLETLRKVLLNAAFSGRL
ncbi:restriction endonuclease subunit S [Streptomyces sp. NPDC017230]|uniref:restriction endonuclease subunit S n=1 Tax=unclassified Streptomyces TaxID=2593676 RepID=UPI0037A6F9BD